jgi:hypothetical protein
MCNNCYRPKIFILSTILNTIWKFLFLAFKLLMTSNHYNDPFDDFCLSKFDLTMLLYYLLNFYLGNTLFKI